jgi:HD-GYP domain-containing protein (c-di-GMP phosphodiesterase class II)
MDEELAAAQALRYADELRELHEIERAHRRGVEEALRRLEEWYTTTVRALATALELRDDATGEHAGRVTRLALRLAERVAPQLCRDPQLEYGFLLHDVGKLGVPDAVLLKQTPLDEDERRELERHPVLGERILAQIPYLGGLARDVVVAHHERWDGTGYPLGLFGTGIPLAARIFALADAFDAMTHDRPYRLALSIAAALAEIEREAGRHFDPTLAVQFVLLFAEEQAA